VKKKRDKIEKGAEKGEDIVDVAPEVAEEVVEDENSEAFMCTL